MINVSWKSTMTLMSSIGLSFMVYVSYLCLCIMHVFVFYVSGLQFVGNFPQCASKSR